MEKNVDVFSLVISKLNDNDMWFTTKADPTAEEARNYYKLDEYGNPTETTINKIVKEVNALIGDGAVNEYDAVDLWINDALVAFTVDYRDNLVTQFEDKPIVDGIEAYENSVQFPKSKKAESKKVKKENIDNHKYKSEYDELDDLLDTYAGIDNGKLELYNAFNNDSMKEFDDDEYDMWLEDMKNEHFDELMEFLKEKDEETSYYMSEIDESKKVTEEFWEDGEKYEYKGIVIQQSISDRGKKIYSILNHQEPFSIPYFSSLRAAKQYIDNNNLKSYKVTESYHKRLYEVNNKSKNLISSMFADSSFDSDSPAGQIVMRTSEMFNALSDKGYDVEVAFDNGESTSAIQLGQQGGKVMITITNTDKPLRAFTSGNIEVTAESIKTLQDIQTQIDVL